MVPACEAAILGRAPLPLPLEPESSPCSCGGHTPPPAAWTHPPKVRQLAAADGWHGGRRGRGTCAPHPHILHRRPGWVRDRRMGQRGCRAREPLPHSTCRRRKLRCWVGEARGRAVVGPGGWWSAARLLGGGRAPPNGGWYLKMLHLLPRPPTWISHTIQGHLRIALARKKSLALHLGMFPCGRPNIENCALAEKQQTHWGRPFSNSPKWLECSREEMWVL